MSFGRRPGYGGAGSGITPIPLDNSDHYFEAEHNAAAQTATPSGGEATMTVDLEDYSSEGTAGFFAQSTYFGAHGLMALQNIVCLTFLEIDPTPGQTIDNLVVYLKFRQNTITWNTNDLATFTQAPIDTNGYVGFPPAQLILPAGMEVYFVAHAKGLVADFSVDYADMELQVIGTF